MHLQGIRIPYALRRVPENAFGQVVPFVGAVAPGDVAIATVEKVAKNAYLELSNGRRSALHEQDTVAVVFGNRYATLQFEGYARLEDDRCDLLSMGGLCGIVESRHAKVAEPTKLRILGAVTHIGGWRLNLREFHLNALPKIAPARIVLVCGSSMDAGKTHTVVSTIMGLRQVSTRVAGIKLTGTATGKDTWNMLDAGAFTALDFVDGGYPSTYLVSREKLLGLYSLLVGNASHQGAEWIVVEIADGLFQQETAALFQSAAFVETLDYCLFAAGDPMAAESGVRMLRQWGIEPIGISGVLTMSALCMREAEAATGLRCYTAKEIQAGDLNEFLQPRAPVQGCAAISPRNTDQPGL